MSNYWRHNHYDETHVKEYPVGYRYYDDYYTYALSWDATKLQWLLNNEPTLTQTTNVPNDSVKIVLGTGSFKTNDPREILSYPNNMQIDYIRAYKDDPTRSLTSINSIRNTTVSLFPNPFSNKLNITLNDANVLGKNTTLYIYDILGREVFTQNIVSQNTIINDINIPSGTYTYAIKQTNTVLFTGKIVAK